MKSRMFFAFATVGGLGIVGTLSLARSDAQPEVAPSHTQVASQAPRCALALGQRFAYTGASHTDLSIDMAPLAQKVNVSKGTAAMAAAPRQAVKMDRSWRLDLEVVDATDAGASILLAQFGRLKTQMRLGAAEIEDGALDAPFLVEVDDRCQLSKFGWRTDADLQAAHDQQSIVSRLGFAYPAVRGARRYPTQLFDVTGRYRANTMVIGDGIAARGLAYSQVFANVGQTNPLNRVGVEVHSAHLRATASADAWFETLSTTQRLGYAINGTSIGHIESTLTVTRATANAQWAPDVDAQDAGWTWGLLLDTPRDQNTSVAADLDGQAMSAADAFATLQAMLDGQGTTPAERIDFLVRWLRENPGAVDDILALIKAGELDDKARLRASLFHAMAAANTQATRAGLMTIFTTEDFAYGYRVDAAQVMVLLKPPPADLLPGLIDAAQNGPDAFGRGSMQLATGMYAGQHAAEHPEWAAEARDALRLSLSTAEGTNDRIRALQAAGNAASDALIADIEPFLEDADAEVRGYAADALRNSNADEAMPLLEAAFLGDEDAGVRMRILAAASEIAQRDRRAPPPGLRDAVAEQLSQVESLPEFTRMAEFLGRGRDAGDAQAAQALQDELAAELRDGTPDPARLQALGRFAHPQWAAR